MNPFFLNIAEKSSNPSSVASVTDEFYLFDVSAETLWEDSGWRMGFSIFKSI
jgi:hypothetical protein